MRVYEDAPHAKMLRDIRAEGHGYTRMATALGLSKSGVCHVTIGRHQAGPRLKKRIEALWNIWKGKRMSDTPDNVVFLAFKRDGNTVEEASYLSCRDCRNKTWVIRYHGIDARARLTCAVCGVYAGHIGWHDDETEWHEDENKGD